MAAPFIVLGSKAANHLIDNHFHKIPDKYVRGETYVPARFSKIKRRHRQKYNSESGSRDDSDSESDWEEEPPTMQQEKSYRDRDIPGVPEYSQESPYVTPPIYSREPPRQRERYMPSPPPMGAAYDEPPSTVGGRSRGRRDSWSDNEEDYDGYRARPQPMRRRSSSYHGPRSTYDDGYGQLQKSRGSGSEHLDRAVAKSRKYKLKEEIEGSFSKSQVGLGGAAVGAIVGGWAADKAQVGYAKGKKPKANPLLTALGAAAAGLAVNALVEKWEESKEDAKADEKDYDNKFGRGGDRGSDSGRASEGGRSRRNGRSRRDSRGYDSDGYD